MLSGAVACSGFGCNKLDREHHRIGSASWSSPNQVLRVKTVRIAHSGNGPDNFGSCIHFRALALKMTLEDCGYSARMPLPEKASVREGFQSQQLVPSVILPGITPDQRPPTTDYCMWGESTPTACLVDFGGYFSKVSRG
jgi:hypothetical protein